MLIKKIYLANLGFSVVTGDKRGVGKLTGKMPEPLLTFFCEKNISGVICCTAQFLTFSRNNILLCVMK
jgi:hypothetical protein